MQQFNVQVGDAVHYYVRYYSYAHGQWEQWEGPILALVASFNSLGIPILCFPSLNKPATPHVPHWDGKGQPTTGWLEEHHGVNESNLIQDYWVERPVKRDLCV